MNCGAFEKAVYLYLKKELPKDQMKEARLHLLQCDDCKTKYYKISILFQKTGEYIRSVEKTDKPFSPDFSSIAYKQEKHHHIFSLYKLTAVATALLFIIISLFVITQRDKDYTVISHKEKNIVSLQKTQQAIIKNDVNMITLDKPAQKDRSAQTADKPIIRDEFSESYRRWLEARRYIAEPVAVEVIYPDLNITTIHFLKNN